MTVNIGKSTYTGITLVQFNELLKIAKDSVPFGIYAIVRKDVAIMLKEKCRSKYQLEKAVKEYENKGFCVYCNAGKNNV